MADELALCVNVAMPVASPLMPLNSMDPSRVERYPRSGVYEIWSSKVRVATFVARLADPLETDVVVNAVRLQPLTVDVLVVQVCVTWLVLPEIVVGKHLT